MHNYYQQEVYDPTDDIIAHIDRASIEDPQERKDWDLADVGSNAPTSHDILFTHDESPLQDRSSYEMLIEQHSMGIAFLKEIAADTVQRVREVNIPGLEGKIERCKWESLMKHPIFTMVPSSVECPPFVIAMVNALAEAKIDDEVIKDILTWKDENGKRKPKWPNSFNAITPLLVMAQRSQDDEAVINFLTDQHGNMRFPGLKGATKLLVYSYRKTNQFTRMTDFLDHLDSESDLWKEEDICRQYIQALNTTDRFSDAIEKFTKGGRTVIPCPASFSVIANLANSFNLAKRHREAIFVLGSWIHNTAARENKFFVAVASIAMGNRGMHREVISLLADRNGKCRFPDSAPAVRELIHAFINTNYTSEAEQLLRGAVRQDIFTGEEIMAIENAFDCKRRSNRQGRW